MSTVYLTEQNLGSFASEADARRMVELLSAKGYDARYGVGRNSEDVDTEQYEADFAECLEQLNA